ncbi:glycosyltransferase family 9 protein [Micromonospora parathelypteridis]|uniref:ADP-heptose:LPS heptosyltransferase n=1 Tax=Micromonospora parathelypteridis TaxID=1839617 RepID=A0A840VPT0_9ACTN|nr:glycosyltransferase family 9 protein [Micromonospora parathelypteridis]MBB5478717.1 ADP-heptose:LPS heptosyltransferase [Micromonospora parathelypteridis]GGO04878.1 LPS biosynthesis-related glycosyltransferase [Micromonospora parathelypteridis]
MVTPSVLGPTAERLPDVQRIAVLRANALGDFVFVLPALDALRAAYPLAEIVLLGAPWHAKLWRDRPGPVDRVLVVPPAPGIRTPEAGEPESSMDDFLAAAVGEGFDLAVQIHGGGANSNPLISSLGARVTVGLRADDAPPLDRWLRYVYYQHEVIRYLEVVALVGAPATTIVPTLAVTDADRAEAVQVLGPAGRPRVALHPGASDTRRRWPAERFAEVARELHGDGYEVLVTGTPSEQEVVDRVVGAAGVPVRPQVGTLSLGGLVGCYAECALVVSNDTGPLHLAAAVGAPTVGIFWVGNLINTANPLRGRHRPICSWTVHCPVCGVDCTPGIYPHRPGDGECPHRDSFVTDVPAVEVLEAARELLPAE